MSADIYVLENDGNSKILDKVQCKDETKELQDLLEKNLQMIPGKQINPEDPLRWMLIKREMPVPDPETGGNRWSIDFVLVDHLARLAFVECKRFQDTRSRREVIGQMFEYAANGSFYWKKNDLKGFAEESAKNLGATLEDELNALFEGETRDVDEFFQQVTDNLEAGQMRLIFFMEEAPYQLKSMVEFLNKQMESTDVLLVEAAQYEHEGKRFVSPMLFGYTEEARRVKKTVTIQKGESKQWDEDSFFEAVKINLKDEEYQAIRNLYDECANMGCKFAWGRGKVDGSFSVKFPSVSRNTVVSVFSEGTLQFAFEAYKRTPTQAEFRDELKNRVETDMGLSFPDDYYKKYPLFRVNQWITQAPVLQKTIREIKQEFTKNID